MTQPVLFCFDGSDGAANAIRSAASLLSSSEAIVLSVAVPADGEFPFNPMGEIVGKLTKLYREWGEYAAELAVTQAQRGAQLATEAGITEARPLTATGKPAPTILRVADENDAAIIVMGSRRYGPITNLLGTVASRVAHEAKRPVLVVPGQ
ncbi:MAG TPA: universal stress protein [Solirubrobacteraceae bacterium]|nr:universal stress protein [Solirubrobacteraceae bacterium]